MGVDTKEIEQGSLEWIYLAQVRVEWSTVKRIGNFFISLKKQAASCIKFFGSLLA
jgi:hypothetical protein